MATTENKKHYLGHRQRIKDKFLNSGSSSFSDYELLELLLTTTIPRKDVKPLAKDLIEKFKTFSGVINAKEKELEQIKGIGKATTTIFKIINASILRVLNNELTKNPVISNGNELINYYKINIGLKDIEEFHILYLDSKCKLIKDETHSTGSINSSSVYPREILKGIIEAGANSIILLHNHPSGDPTPSESDIAITQKIKYAINSIDVILNDHLIISKNNYYSFKEHKLL